MDHLRVPREVSFGEIQGGNVSWSPSTFRRVIIPNPAVKPVGELLAAWHNGTEVGSLAYVGKSANYFVRTKALQRHLSLTQSKGDSIVPITTKAFSRAAQNHPERIVHDGDVLYARGGSVGEVAIAYECGQAVISGHLLKLLFKEHPFYCFAFMKHPICKLQQEHNVKGAIRALDNFNIATLLNCRIPFPNQPDAKRVVRYVSVLMQTIIDKEKALRERHRQIMATIASELLSNTRGKEFRYAYPNISVVKDSSRFDSGLYCEGFRRLKHLIDDYVYGSTCLSKMGIKSRRGPNLAVSVIGKSLYSEEAKAGWYRLIRPVNISEYGTLQRLEWLGTSKNLPLVNQGELILGCEGFEKGRTIVLVEPVARCTTNFHGTALYMQTVDLSHIIFLRCFLAFLREQGAIDWVGVGGSGGHMSPEYFDYLPIPRFGDSKKEEIARLYHQYQPAPLETPTLDTFVGWHYRWNHSLGIWDLDREMKALQNSLSSVQEKIIRGEDVIVPLSG